MHLRVFSETHSSDALESQLDLPSSSEDFFDLPNHLQISMSLPVLNF